MKHHLMAAGFAALFATSHPALGQTPNIVVESKAPVEIVSYADLDLSTPRGIATLHQRLRDAAHRLCAGQGPHGVWRPYAVRACFTRTVAYARGQAESAIVRSSSRPFARRNTITVTGR